MELGLVFSDSRQSHSFEMHKSRMFYGEKRQWGAFFLVLTFAAILSVITGLAMTRSQA